MVNRHLWFLGIFRRMHLGNSLKFYMLMYPDHLQNWWDFGHALLIFLIKVPLLLIETGHIWGLGALSGDCLGVNVEGGSGGIFPTLVSRSVFFRNTSKKTSKLCAIRPLWGESTSYWWIPLTKSQQCGKCFHVMTSQYLGKESPHIGTGPCCCLWHFQCLYCVPTVKSLI